MERRNFGNVARIQAALAVLPGIWLIIRYTPGFSTSIPTEALTLVVALLLAVGLFAASFYDKKRIMPWSLPGLGVVVFQTWHLLRYFQYRRRAGQAGSSYGFGTFWGEFISGSPTLLVLIGVMIALGIFVLGSLVLYWIYRRFKRLSSRTAWALVGIVVTSAVIRDYLAYYPHRGYLSGALIDTFFFSVPLLLGPIALGLPLARHGHLKAGLLVVSCAPLWIEMISSPGAALHAQILKSYNSSAIETAWYVLSYLPLLSGFLITPVGLLRSRSARGQQNWLLLPLFFTLLAMSIIRYFALNRTAYEYTWITWLRDILAFVQVWIPVVLTVVLYNKSSTISKNMVHTTG